MSRLPTTVPIYDYDYSPPGLHHRARGDDMVPPVGASGGPWPQVVASLLAQHTALLQKLAASVSSPSGSQHQHLPSLPAAPAQQTLTSSQHARRKWRNRRNRQRKKLRRLYNSLNNNKNNTNNNVGSGADNTSTAVTGNGVDVGEESRSIDGEHLTTTTTTTTTRVQRTLKSVVRYDAKILFIIIISHF